MNNKQLVVAVTSGGYWGKGVDLESAIAKCRESGATGTQLVVIYIYTGPEKALDEVFVDGDGSIHFAQELTSNRVGAVRMPMKNTGIKE